MEQRGNGRACFSCPFSRTNPLIKRIHDFCLPVDALNQRDVGKGETNEQSNQSIGSIQRNTTQRSFI